MANPSHSWRGALLAILGAALLCIVVVEATCKKDSYIHKPGDECPPDFTAVAGVCWQKCDSLANYTDSKFKDNTNDCASYCTTDSVQCTKVTVATAASLGILRLTSTYDNCPSNRTKG